MGRRGEEEKGRVWAGKEEEERGRSETHKQTSRQSKRQTSPHKPSHQYVSNTLCANTIEGGSRDITPIMLLAMPPRGMLIENQ